MSIMARPIATLVLQFVMAVRASLMRFWHVIRVARVRYILAISMAKTPRSVPVANL